ncbi:hypothetical protein CDAR_262901 [Caerostris darwini]|uniref:Secreted protein n=1 Tax=Caerostris darwini TaxID=1538125 RepID=A0AAV4RXF7_9ARAC|nr:hypothetical protein CDAR_262901 [Caerostris darwini]
MGSPHLLLVKLAEPGLGLTFCTCILHSIMNVLRDRPDGKSTHYPSPHPTDIHRLLLSFKRPGADVFVVAFHQHLSVEIKLPLFTFPSNVMQVNFFS